MATVYKKVWQEGTYGGLGGQWVTVVDQEATKKSNDAEAKNKTQATSNANAANAAIQAQQAADAAAAAEAKKQADLKAFNESIMGAQKAVQSGNQSIQAQFAAQEEQQRQADAEKIASQPQAVASSASGFDIGEAQKAGIAKTGAASSGAGKGMKPGAGGQQATPPSSQTGVERNRFALPEMKDIKLGGL